MFWKEGLWNDKEKKWLFKEIFLVFNLQNKNQPTFFIYHVVLNVNYLSRRYFQSVIFGKLQDADLVKS